MSQTRKAFTLFVTATLVLVFGQSSFCQDTKKPKAKPAPRKQQAAKPPAAETLVLETSDKVKLKVTYFGAAEKEEATQALPIILIHDWEGNRKQLLEYGAYLQSRGHAVIVPDLRGHGESTTVTNSKILLDATKFRKNEVASVQKDIERCKKYLVKRNNEGKVNIDLLSVVAVGKSSVIAVQWVLNDWFAFPSHNADGIKQGQDVKSLVLVSPQKKLKGISLMSNIKHPLYTGSSGAAIPMVIVWAENDEECAKDAESLFKMLEKARPDVSGIEDAAKRDKLTTLYGIPIKNQSHSGVKMMNKPIVNGLWPYTQKLFTFKVEANKAGFPWKSREKEKDDE